MKLTIKDGICQCDKCGELISTTEYALVYIRCPICYGYTKPLGSLYFIYEESDIDRYAKVRKG